MTRASLAERICPRASGPCSACCENADAVTAHLAAILADVETVEAVARELAAPGYDEPSNLHRLDARAAIAVIGARLGLS